MLKKKITKKILLFTFYCVSFKFNSQVIDSNIFSIKTATKPLELIWNSVIPGLDFCETMAPRKSEINDSKITLFRVNPDYFDFRLLMATEHYNKPLNVKDWADSFDLNIVFNAGMYDLSKKLYSKGFLKGEKHINQEKIHPNYKTMIAFNPKDTLDKKFTISDLECDSFNQIKNKYSCLAQGLRMLDCNSKPIAWNKRKQYCSQLISTIDEFGNVYLIFVRSPYLHNEMIQFMQDMKLNLYNAIYLEGGPQTSLYVNIQKDGKEIFHLEKIGSYVSETYATDKNDYFWKLPNVIGLKNK
jgi:hypothetical protein